MKQDFQTDKVDWFPKLLVWLMTLTLWACASPPLQIKLTNSIPQAPYSDGHLFGKRPLIIENETIYHLSEKQKQDFLIFFESKNNRALSPNRRIYEYLLRYVKNYHFLNQTLIASQSLEQSKGNCLSLAILTSALANAVAVDTGYQLVESTPVYQKEGNIILSSLHVRSLLFEQKKELDEGLISMGRKGLIVDYFPTRGSHVRRNVSQTEFIAMYYRNKAADSIIEKDYNSAYWLLRKTLDYIPTDEHAINMMAIVHENSGLSIEAEKLYRYGIKYANNKLDLLRNYHIFLKKEHRINDAKEVKLQLTTIKISNPFDWINLGHSAFDQHQYIEARRYFKRAAKLAPYLHQAYMGIAKAEYKLGNVRAAKESLNAALEKAFSTKTKSLYQAKLAALAQI